MTPEVLFYSDQATWYSNICSSFKILSLLILLFLKSQQPTPLTPPRRPTEVQDRIFLHGQHISCALQVISNAFLFWARSWCWSQRYSLFCFFCLNPTYLMWGSGDLDSLNDIMMMILCALDRIPPYDNRAVIFV